MDEQEFTAWAAGCERQLVRSAYLLTGDLHRAVLVMRHFDDLAEREPAEVLGVSIATVKSQNAADLARLRFDYTTRIAFALVPL